MFLLIPNPKYPVFPGPHWPPNILQKNLHIMLLCDGPAEEFKIELQQQQRHSAYWNKMSNVFLANFTISTSKLLAIEYAVEWDTCSFTIYRPFTMKSSLSEMRINL